MKSVGANARQRTGNHFRFHMTINKKIIYV